MLVAPGLDKSRFLTHGTFYIFYDKTASYMVLITLDYDVRNASIYKF